MKSIKPKTNKKRLTNKQLENRKAYRKEYNRIKRLIKRAEKRGYVFNKSVYNLLKEPKRLTIRSVEKLKRIKPEDIYKKSSIELEGKKYKGLEGRKKERSLSAIKSAQTRKANKEKTDFEKALERADKFEEEQRLKKKKMTHHEFFKNDYEKLKGYFQPEYGELQSLLYNATGIDFVDEMIKGIDQISLETETSPWLVFSKAQIPRPDYFYLPSKDRTTFKSYNLPIFFNSLEREGFITNSICEKLILGVEMITEAPHRYKTRTWRNR